MAACAATLHPPSRGARRSLPRTRPPRELKMATDDLTATINPRAAALGDGARTRSRAPGLEHAGLAGVLVLSGLFEFVRLGQNGFANTYYSAAVKSMLRSWHNFFFVAADPNGMITVDKPPLALWLQTVSAKIFGFAPLSL